MNSITLRLWTTKIRLNYDAEHLPGRMKNSMMKKKKEIKSKANIVRHSVGYPCKSDENKYNIVYFSLKVM